MNLEQTILNEMKSMGKRAASLLDDAAATESMLSGLLANRDDVPKDMLKPLDDELKTIREGKSNLNEKLADIEKTLRRNGNNNRK
jgi:hypothetical protein